jgi:simple sugar transport system permease protein/ribose transport system permease protein
MADLQQATAPSIATERFAIPGWARKAGSAYGILGALIALFLFNAFFTDNFLTMQSMRVNLTQVAPVVIVAVGMTLVIGTGGIDLSVGSLMAISGTVAALIFLSDRFSSQTVANFVAVPVALLIASAFGAFNGALVAVFKIQPIIATLVLFIAGRGIAQVLTNGALQSFKNPDFQYIGLGRPFGIPFQAFIMLAAVILGAWIVRSTTFGRSILAVGGNERAARLAGVHVGRVKMLVYIISGLLSGIAGLIAIAINSSADANLVGKDMELNAIAAVAVGGTPLTGGRAAVWGTLMGALLLQLTRTTLLSHDIEDAVARIVTASAIVAAVLIQRNRRG